jgi:hypothetical protein
MSKPKTSFQLNITINAALTLPAGAKVVKYGDMECVVVGGKFYSPDIEWFEWTKNGDNGTGCIEPDGLSVAVFDHRLEITASDGPQDINLRNNERRLRDKISELLDDNSRLFRENEELRKKR